MTNTAKSPTPKPSTTAILKETVAEQANTIVSMEASIADLALRWEDRGWRRLNTKGFSNDVSGLELDSIKTISEDLRAWVVGGLLKRIIEVRGNTIYGDGVGFSKFAKAKRAFESPNNIEKLFSVDALQTINRAHGTDGQVVFLVHKRTKEITRFFIADMQEPYLDGNDQERIWFVRRAWNRVTPTKPNGEDVDLYYATDLCPAEYANKASVAVGSGRVRIDRDFTAIVWDVNKQGGWPLGIPDLVASLEWAERYTGYLKNQDKFAEALASIAWEYHAANVPQATKMTASLATEGIASTATTVPGMELRPQAGNSDVSFDNGSAMAAMAAALGEITVDDLLAVRATAAATTLDPNVKDMATARRMSATAFFKRIGKLLGAPNLEVIWPDLETESPFREAQMIISAFTQTGAYGIEEIRGPLAQRVRIPIAEGSTAPAGVLQPHTKEALEIAAKVVRDNAPEPGAGGGGVVDGNQGQSTDVGKLSDGIDQNAARDRGEVTS